MLKDCLILSLLQTHDISALKTLSKKFQNYITLVAECIVELYKHAGIFKNTIEVHRLTALI